MEGLNVFDCNCIIIIITIDWTSSLICFTFSDSRCPEASWRLMETSDQNSWQRLRHVRRPCVQRYLGQFWAENQKISQCFPSLLSTLIPSLLPGQRLCKCVFSRERSRALGTCRTLHLNPCLTPAFSLQCGPFVILFAPSISPLSPFLCLSLPFTPWRLAHCLRLFVLAPSCMSSQTDCERDGERRSQG